MTNDRDASTDAPFRVLVTAALFEPGFRGGGPVKSVARIIDTAPEGIEVTLITSDRDLGTSNSYPGLSGKWIQRGRSHVFYLAVNRPQQWLRLLRTLRAKPYDLLYLNSLWQPIFTVIPVLAVRLRIVRAPHILLAPRGELSPGALSIRTSKKRMFLRVWRPLLRTMNVLWHASADREANDILRVFPDAQVMVNSIQIGLPVEPLPAGSGHDGPVRLVFISRISPKKNLSLALEALEGLSGDVTLDIYGPIEDAGYWARCQSVMARLPEHIRANYRGELAPDVVRETFSRYDAFLFPTLGENFGHVIAESLSAACPVICSDETPWTDLLQRGGGMVVRDLTSSGLMQCLQRLVSMGRAERLRAKQSAADVYFAWRGQRLDHNVLAEFRLGLVNA
jgi:glycosyltransferase involved in cell wall biosynthesis